MRLAYASLLALVTSQISAQPAPAVPPTGFVVDTLATGIYAFVRREPIGYGMQSNSLLIVGKRTAAIVDAQFNVSDTRTVIAAIRKLTTLPVRYVVNTHCHDDHVSGNIAYARAFPGVDFVASDVMAAEMSTICARNRASFRASGPGTAKYLRNLAANNQSIIGGQADDEERVGHLSYARLIEQFLLDPPTAPVAPTITFSNRMSLDLGDQRVDIIRFGRGHSGGDAIVHVPAAGVVAAGDLVIWPVPFVGSTSWPGEFAATLDSLLALNPRVILPGHGPLLRETSHVREVSRMLKHIKAGVSASVAQGDSLPQVQRSVDLTEFRTLFGGTSTLRLGLFDFYVKSSAVSAEYRAITGK